MWLDHERSEETTTPRCLNSSIPSSGILFRLIGEAGVVGVLFLNITMCLHLETLKLRLLLEEHFSIAATSFLSAQKPLWVEIAGNSRRSSAYIEICDPTEIERDACMVINIDKEQYRGPSTNPCGTPESTAV